MAGGAANWFLGLIPTRTIPGSMTLWNQAELIVVPGLWGTPLESTGLNHSSVSLHGSDLEEPPGKAEAALPAHSSLPAW